ncbi:neuropeptides capa receptor [Caerostris extrusa]|uniref:Neuropeptides capa receptor n=1 Tax=Caerostris extrusa TaxID=172846 RepID=A0AAV4T339_CAEEX|nr:neuropeptides capa receptor [Caerostris extrusa]
MPLELYSLWHQYPWQLGTLTCILRSVVSEATAYASILTIMTFSCEQYYAVCHPLHQTTKSKIKRAFRNIVIIWLVSFVTAAPYGFFTKVNYLTVCILLCQYSVEILKYNLQRHVNDAYCITYSIWIRIFKNGLIFWIILLFHIQDPYI